MIFENTAYSPGNQKDLGAAYNSFMKLLGDDDWALFRDHDTMFCGYNWYPLAESVINKYSDAGLITCYTNRIGCRWQLLSGVNQRNNDMRYHWKIGEMQQKIFTGKLIDTTNMKPPASGLMILTSKKVWKAVGGFKSGILGVDNDYHNRVANAGFKVYLHPGIYLYHWYRNNVNNTNHLVAK